MLSKSKSRNYVTWIANLTKLFLSVCGLCSQYIQVRKLFKGGNYSRAETIRGNTVCYLNFLNWVYWNLKVQYKWISNVLQLSRSSRRLQSPTTQAVKRDVNLIQFPIGKAGCFSDLNFVYVNSTVIPMSYTKLSPSKIQNNIIKSLVHTINALLKYSEKVTKIWPKVEDGTNFCDPLRISEPLLLHFSLVYRWYFFGVFHPTYSGQNSWFLIPKESLKNSDILKYFFSSQKEF